MLFTTAVFALVFLPVTLAGFFAFGRWRAQAAAGWLFAASVFFYGFWMPAFTLLLLASIGFNFVAGTRIARSEGAARRRWLVAGIVVDMLLLAYFKYANFFVDNLNIALGTHWAPGRVVLPIGISFYTFTQIAYLVDNYRRKVNEFNIVHYGLFVTYFPHLVAGPVLHHAQMMPQFAQPSIYRWNGAQFGSGLAIFAIGLVKKVALADGVAPYADAVFRPADAGTMPAQGEAWLGALAYTLQLYFDFSGYSDMAIGLSWMFNVKLPYNCKRSINRVLERRHWV
jgi:alginate O-acetyltransferase complex protein AlgI